MPRVALHTLGCYVYDADGMRVRATPSGGTATDFMLDGREIAEEMTGSGDISYVGPGLISAVSGTTETVYHADGIGSTRAMSDGNAAVTEAGIYDAYGRLLMVNGAAAVFGFAGEYRYYADATGLQYLKARYYDAIVARFASRDPIGYRGGFNMYAYVADNPLVVVDPGGLFGIVMYPYPYDTLESCMAKCKAGYDDCKDLVGAGSMIGTGVCAGLGVIFTPVVGGACEAIVLVAGGSTWLGCWVGYKRCLGYCETHYPKRVPYRCPSCPSS